MAEFIARWFTPSDSDQTSGAQYNTNLNAQQQAAAAAERARRPAEVKQELRETGRAKKKTVTKFGGAPAQPSLLSDQAAVAKTLLGQ